MSHLHRWGAPTAALLLLALVPLALSACGGGSSTSSDSTATTGSGAAAQKAAKTIRRSGHEATGKQAKQVEAVVLGYLGALAGREWSKACSYLAKQVRQLRAAVARGQGASESCADGVRALAEERSSSGGSGGLADLAKAEVSSVRTEGERGYVFYEVPASGEYAAAVTRQGGHWRVSIPTEVPMSS
ncbi:MAG TPA: hypothetical protein VFG58_03450 [Solirubrobacterales bacterium]|nr:hypothetical protein [Solirubrobacterales bacterium]